MATKLASSRMQSRVAHRRNYLRSLYDAAYTIKDAALKAVDEDVSDVLYSQRRRVLDHAKVVADEQRLDKLALIAFFQQEQTQRWWAAQYLDA